jgi:excisionase family DNA binding protein
MFSFNHSSQIQVLHNHISVQVAASYSGYNAQYIRRMLRSGKIQSVKVGQMWLIDKAALDNYLRLATLSTDNRFGPK